MNDFPVPCHRRDVLGTLRFRRLARTRKDVAWDPPQSPTPEYLYRPSELLTPVAEVPRVQGALKGFGATAEVRRETETGLAVLHLVSRVAVPELLAELEHRDPSLAGVVTPNHWFLGTPWSHFGPGDEPTPPAGARPAPRKSGGDGVRVAIVDSGFLEVGFARPWLSSGVDVDPPDIENPDSDGDGFVDFDAGHGTFVAGCVRMVAPGAEVHVDQALDHDGLVSEDVLSEQVAQALARQPQLLNLSLGAYTRDDRTPLGVAAWEPSLKEAGELVVVAAAGNDATSDRFYPAALPWVLGVAATTSDGTARASFSNFGDWVDCCARGTDLVNAYAVGRYRDVHWTVNAFRGLARWSGTSFATPLVVGAIAARMAADGVGAPEARDRVLADAAAAGTLPGLGPFVDV